jgi:plasmid stabilization system protein ParE
MTNGYKILWTDFALLELEQTIIYLEENWTERELKNLVIKLEETLFLISQNPNLFQDYGSDKNIRKVVIANYNSLYYRINGETIEILSFFSNRQNPKKLKLK